MMGLRQPMLVKGATSVAGCEILQNTTCQILERGPGQKMKIW